ncbi:N-acetylglucosamine-1-phosphodiester alpha-N-acetylglucosaminidase [Podarcis muralis]
MAASIERLVYRVGEGQRPTALIVFSMVLLRCLLGVQGHAVAWNSLNDDLLPPYLPPRHGPRHHHRYVRDCQALRHGNTTHESWPSNNSTVSPLTVTSIFISDIPPKGQNSRHVYGHLTTVRDPLRTFSVLEPGGPGGCRKRSRATVEETARHGKCLVAQNGGYFNTKTGECLGNVVSDGHLIQSSGGIQNANFGIRKDGTLVFGYLSEEDVLAKDNPFVQLVSGVGWLLRDGEVYVNQSRAVECDETQETGTFDKFINTVSARTAVGHDRQGQLVLAHFDGQTHTRGLSLWDMADFLKQQRVVNAINLDGGGSATLVLNGTLASYPSDHCEHYPMWRCPRQVSTILCVHEPVCQPPDCNGHGHCILGECQCNGALWRGPACDVLDCGPSNCTLHGICTEEGCLCDAGWKSPNCSEACAPGSYGDGCLQTCLCLNGGACDPVHGTCNCSAGYQGTHCEEVCPSGRYGPNCQDACPCPNQRPCDRKTGSCNVSAECPLPDDVVTGQCLLKADEKGALLGFTIKGWFIGVLSVLLLVSAGFNIKHFCCSSSTGRQNYNDYFSRRPNSSHYELLGKSNSFPLAGGENEDYTEDTET